MQIARRTRGKTDANLRRKKSTRRRKNGGAEHIFGISIGFGNYSNIYSGHLKFCLKATTLDGIFVIKSKFSIVFGVAFSIDRVAKAKME
uniref:Uncharacterized protein n=1 Tax=Romanomermis culicivorax TaxID=13658 RepID=A0A915IDS8_ROMCU